MNLDSATFPSPPDLTQYLVKSNASGQYYTGGGFGDVYRCWCHNDDLPKEVAVKALRFNFTMNRSPSDKSTKMLRRELGIWRRLDHVNIVPFLGIAHGFGMCDSMSLVSQWMPNNSLNAFLEKHDGILDPQHRLQFLLDIANGLNYLHTTGPIVHGDLNCNNVLVDENYSARLVDFGYASLVGNIPEALNYLQMTTVRPGSFRWAAPERVVQGGADGEFVQTTKSDVYSFGCIALQECFLYTIDVLILTLSPQVLSGKQPWSEVREDMAVVVLVSKGHKPGRPSSRAIDDQHWNFIRQCWACTEERPDADMIIVAIQGFLNCLPPLRSLSDVFMCSSSPAESNTMISPLNDPKLTPEETVQNAGQAILKDLQVLLEKDVTEHVVAAGLRKLVVEEKAKVMNYVEDRKSFVPVYDEPPTDTLPNPPPTSSASPPYFQLPGQMPQAAQDGLAQGSSAFIHDAFQVNSGQPMDTLPYPPPISFVSPPYFHLLQAPWAARDGLTQRSSAFIHDASFQVNCGHKQWDDAPVRLGSAQSYMHELPSPSTLAFPQQYLSSSGSRSLHRHSRSPSPRSSLRVSQVLHTERSLDKKPALACLFCRGSAITCGQPPSGSPDKTCK